MREKGRATGVVLSPLVCPAEPFNGRGAPGLKPGYLRQWRFWECSGLRSEATVDGHRSLLLEGLMGPLEVVVLEPRADARMRHPYVVVRVEVDLLVLQRSPETLNEDVVHAAPFPVHADLDPGGLQYRSEIAVSELRALVAVEDRRRSMVPKGLLQRLNAKAGWTKPPTAAV